MSGAPSLNLGRYTLHAVIARGGMAQVHVGRLAGPAGFSKVVAIKRLFPHLAEDREFRTMLLDEARLASRIEHPNVVATLDVVAERDELFVVMELVRGASVAEILRHLRESGDDAAAIPLPIVSAIAMDMLRGLHAAHEARAADGTPLHTVHRDVSPHNVLVGADGRARIADFGVAKAAMRLQSTRDGQVKGKLSYMAPEQFKNVDIDRRVDVYAAGLVLWEMLTGERRFTGDDPAAVVGAILEPSLRRASERHPRAQALDDVIARAIDADRSRRFATAAEMAEAVRAAAPIASSEEVGAWVAATMRDRIASLDEAALATEHARAPAADPADPGVVKASSAAATGRFDWNALDGAPTSATSATATELDLREPTSDATPIRAAAAFVVVALAAAASFVVFRSPFGTTPVEATVPPAPSASSAAATTETPAATPSTVNAPAPDGDAGGIDEVDGLMREAAPAASLAPNAASRTKAPARPPAGRTKTRTSTAASVSSARADCDPPFTIDERGVKHFKRGCM